MSTTTRRVALTVLLISSVTLTACTPNDPFISEARDKADVPASITDEQLMKASDVMCESLRAGKTTLAAYLDGVGEWEPFDDEGVVLDIAKKHNCPDA